MVEEKERRTPGESQDERQWQEEKVDGGQRDVAAFVASSPVFGFSPLLALSLRP